MTPPDTLIVNRRMPNLGIELVTLDSPNHFCRHSHDQYGVGVILCGCQKSWSGKGYVTAGPGDIITVNPGEVHDGMPLDCVSRKWRMIYLDSHVLPPCEFTSPAFRDHRIASKVQAVFASSGIDQEQHLVTLLNLMPTTGKRQKTPSTLSIERVLARIHSEPQCDVTLTELANVAEASRYQLIRAFRRAKGLTPYQYIIQLRLQMVRRLLASGEAPVDAALQSGFADQSHMTRTFVRQFGLTPGSYRNFVLD